MTATPAAVSTAAVLHADAESALAPLRARLRADAHAAASAILAEAEEKAAALVAEAEADAAGIRATAVAAGEESARSEVALRSARVRRQAHEAVLTAREDLRLEVRRRVLEGARGLVEDPRYPTLLERLRERARATLGPDAHLAEAPEGGLVAEAGSRRLDLRFPTLAQAALGEVSELWGAP